MNFEYLDGYLLDGRPPKVEVVQRLLRERPGGRGASPFYEGMRFLGARTPDLSLLALRLVLAGKLADDAAVTRLRDLSFTARLGGPDALAARQAFARAVGS